MDFGHKYTKEELHQLMLLKRSGAAGFHRSNSGNTRRKRTRGAQKAQAIKDGLRS